MNTIAQNLEIIRSRIANAARAAGRDPQSVRLLAVSKTFPASDVMEAFSAGQTCFGENRVQELENKVPVCDPSIEWHLIGHLQSNKAAKAAALAQWIHSVDSVHLAEKISKAAETAGKMVNILLEVNVSGEESKFGIRSDTELMEIAKAVIPLPGIVLRGLMTMAPANASQDDLHLYFGGLRKMRDQIQKELAVSLDTLSMGMSGDFETAIAEGATIVRVGTAVFGGRSYPTT